MEQKFANVATAQRKFLFMGGVTPEGVPRNAIGSGFVQLPVKIPGDGITVGIAKRDMVNAGSPNGKRPELLAIRRNGVPLDPVDEGLMTRVL